MPDLVEFLTARLNEEQRLAEWAAKPHLGPQEPGDTAVWQVEEWVPSEHEEGAVPAAIWVTDRSEMGIGQMRPDLITSGAPSGARSGSTSARSA